MKCKHNAKEISDMFYMPKNQIYRYINLGVPYEKIYEVFKNEKITRKEKKNFLYNKSNFENYPIKKLRNIKDVIWERYMGDRSFVNTNLYDNKIEITVENILN